MSKVCTSVEESRRLVELGLSPATCDMYYTLDPYLGKHSGFAKILPNISFGEAESLFSSLEPVPAWSLSALISLLPVNTNVEKKDTIVCGSSIYSVRSAENNERHYQNGPFNEPFACVYGAVEYMLGRGLLRNDCYIKKKKYPSKTFKVNGHDVYITGCEDKSCAMSMIKYKRWNIAESELVEVDYIPDGLDVYNSVTCPNYLYDSSRFVVEPVMNSYK